MRGAQQTKEPQMSLKKIVKQNTISDIIPKEKLLVSTTSICFHNIILKHPKQAIELTHA